MNMETVRLRQLARSARKFHCDLLAEVTALRKAYLNGHDHVIEHILSIHGALTERIAAEGPVEAVHGQESTRERVLAGNYDPYGNRLS